MIVETWDREDLRSGDSPSEPCPAEIDLTGRIRIIAFGPYAKLQPGRWRLVFQFEVCEYAAGYPLLLQFGEGNDFVEIAYIPRKPGFHELCLMRDWPGGAKHAELRLWVSRPVFHGLLRFCAARVEQLEKLPLEKRP